jgi:hypothetical protein
MQKRRSFAIRLGLGPMTAKIDADLIPWFRLG